MLLFSPRDNDGGATGRILPGVQVRDGHEPEDIDGVTEAREPHEEAAAPGRVAPAPEEQHDQRRRELKGDENIIHIL